MSVIKSKRRTSGVQFLDTARELDLYTMKTCIKFIPKRYTFYLAQPTALIASNIHSCVKRGNSIFPATARDYEMRREQFIMAEAELQNLISKINIIYELFPLPDNVIIKWHEFVDKEITLIKNLIKKDEERFKSLV